MVSRPRLKLSTFLACLLLPLCLHAATQNVLLETEWKFQQGDDLGWASPTFDDSPWRTKALPQLWEDPGYPASNQIAWYRLSIDASELAHLSAPAIRVGFVRNAYEIYVNGERLGGVGRLPPDPVVTFDHERVYLLDRFITSDDTLVIALRVWGGSDLAVEKAGGGPYAGRFLLGDYPELLAKLQREDIPVLTSSALFLLLGVYFLYLFHRTREIKSFLWFGLTALILSLYLMTQSQWKHSLDLSFVTLEKIESCTYFMTLVLTTELVFSILDRPANWLLRCYQGYFILLTLLLLLVPGLAIHYHIRPLWQFGSLVAIVPVFYALFTAIAAGNKDARTLLYGIAALVAFSFHDLMVLLQIIEGSFLISLGFIGLAVSMAVILANKFSTLVLQLESEVDQRTADLEAANSRLNEMSRIDPLTALLNRRGFEAEAELEIQRFARQKSPLGLVITDIDFFKRFNDEYGHDCGDLVLKEVADLMKGQTRDIDRVARWGGEEFVLLLPDTGPAGVENIAEKIRFCVEQHRVRFNGELLAVTMTFGGAVFRKGETFAECLKRADEMLYKGKSEGRNRVVVDQVTDSPPSTGSDIPVM